MAAQLAASQEGLSSVSKYYYYYYYYYCSRRETVIEVFPFMRMKIGEYLL
jgi:hypothetical protein